MAVDFRDAVGAPRVKARGLILRGLADLAEHLAARRLVELDAVRRSAPRLRGAGHDANRLQHSEHAEASDFAGELGLVPGKGHEADGGKVVDLVGLDALHAADERGLVQEIALDNPDVRKKLLDLLPLRVGLSADQAVDLVALRQQVLGEIGAILAGDAGDKRPRHAAPPFEPGTVSIRQREETDKEVWVHGIYRAR